MTSTFETDPTPRPVRVWDLPTRLFHWALAATVIAAVVSAKIGGSAMIWHTRLGLTVFALLAFRLLWGLVGGHWSRFARFIYAPSTLWRYLRGLGLVSERLDVGHSPVGSLSVFAMLGVLALQVGTGLIGDDEIATVGPLNRFVDTDTGLLATSWHKQYGQWLVIALVVLHLAAIVFYLLRRKRNLVQPMIVGDKLLAPSTPASADGIVHRLFALILVLACAALAVWVARLGG